MVVPAVVRSLEDPAVPTACQPRHICRAGGWSPKSQLAERLAANLRVLMGCCQRPAQGARVSVRCGCWGAQPQSWHPLGRDIPVTTAFVPAPTVRELCGTWVDSVLSPRCAGRCLLGFRQPTPGSAHGRWPFREAFPIQM